VYKRQGTFHTSPVACKLRPGAGLRARTCMMSCRLKRRAHCREKNLLKALISLGFLVRTY